MNTTLDAIGVAVSSCITVLARRPSALITDIDGTISAIVSRPEDATVDASVRESLDSLSRHLALVAVITAREEAVAKSMVGIDALTYVGNYALEDLTIEDASVYAPIVAALAPLFAELPCVTVEEKGIAVSFHYRNCEALDARERLLTAVTPLATAESLRVIEGKQVVELVPSELPHKGHAINRLLAEHDIQGVVYLGDDLADVAVFKEIAVRREEGKPGIGIAVLDAETPQAVRTAADLELEGVAATTQLLSRLAQMLGEGG